MQIRGRVVSISENVAEVCILREHTTCGSCSACPKKMGVSDITRVAVIEGIQIGQAVILRDNIPWLSKHRALVILAAFILGIGATEAVSAVAPLGSFRGKLGLLAGGMLTLIALIISWVKKPRYLFRIEHIQEGRT